MAKSERAENLDDYLNGKRIPAGKNDGPARGAGVTADNTKARKPLDTSDYDTGKGRHRR